MPGYSMQCNIRYPVTGHILGLNLHIKFIYCFKRQIYHVLIMNAMKWSRKILTQL